MRTVAIAVLAVVFGCFSASGSEAGGYSPTGGGAGEMLRQAEKFENAVANNLASAEYLLTEVIRLHPATAEADAAAARLSWIRSMSALALQAPPRAAKVVSAPAVDWRREPVPDAEAESLAALAEEAVRDGGYESLQNASFRCTAFLIRRPDAQDAWKVRGHLERVDAALRKLTGQPAKKALARKEIARKYRLGESMESLVDMAASRDEDSVPLLPSGVPEGTAESYFLDAPKYELLIIPGE